MDSSADACVQRSMMGAPGDPRAFTQYIKSMSFDTLQGIAWAGALNSSHPITLVEGGPGTGKTRLSIALAISLSLRSNRVLLVDLAPRSCCQTMEEINEHRDILLKMDPSLEARVKILTLPHRQDSRHEGGGGTNEEILFDAYDMVQANEDALEIEPWVHTVKLYQKKSDDKGLAPDIRNAAQKWLATLETIEADRFGTLSKKPNSQLCRGFVDGAREAIKEIMADQALKLVVADRCAFLMLDDSPFKPQILVLDNATSASEEQMRDLLSLGFQRVILIGDRAIMRPLMTEMAKFNLPHQLRHRYTKKTATDFTRLAENPRVPYCQIKINYRSNHDVMFLPGLLSYEWSFSAPKYTTEEQNAYKVVLDFWKSDSGKPYRENRRDPGFRPRVLQNEGENRIRRLMFNVKGGRSVGSTSMVNYANGNQIADIVSKILRHLPENRKLQALKSGQITIVTSTEEQRKAIDNSIQLQRKRSQLGQLGDLPEICTMESWGGCSENIIILDITPASHYQGASLGQYTDWHRMNTVLTSCKNLIWLVGNLDLWRSELNILMMKPQTRNFGFLIIDLLDLGDVIDVQGTNAIPKTWQELHTDPLQWTNQLRPSRPPKKEKYWFNQAKAYKADKKAQEKLENHVLKHLQAGRARAEELQMIFESGKGPGLDYFMVARPTVEERKLLEELRRRLKK